MNTYVGGDYLSKTDLRGRCGRASAGGGLSNQGVLRCLDCTDLVELGGSHLEFSGHLTDGERPAAMHHHPVFTECPLGQDQMIQDRFCFSKTCVISPAGPSHLLLPRSTKHLRQHLGHWVAQVSSSVWSICTVQSPWPFNFWQISLTETSTFSF